MAERLREGDTFLEQIIEQGRVMYEGRHARLADERCRRACVELTSARNEPDSPTHRADAGQAGQIAVSEGTE